MTEEDLKRYVNVSMYALHRACDLLAISEINFDHLENDKVKQLFFMLINDGAEGLVNYFLYEAEEELGYKI